jgi:hypothetical protein
MQSPSVPIDSRPSSQSQDAHPTILGSGYRKHSLGDILQSPGGISAKRTRRRKSSAQVPNASQTKFKTADQASYEVYLRLSEERKTRRLMMARRKGDEAFLNGSGGMTEISATGPANNSTNVDTSMRKPISERRREKSKIGGTSNDTTSKAPIVEKDAQKHSSPLPAVQSILPPRELENLPSSGNHAPEEGSAAKNFGLDELNCGAYQLKKLCTAICTAIAETKIRIDQEVDEIPKIVLYIEQARAFLSVQEGSIPQRQRIMIDPKEAEVKTLEAKFEELIVITNGTQKKALQKIKDDAILPLQREIDDLKNGEDPFSKAIKGSKAQLEGDLARVKCQTASLIEALEGLLEKLP